MVLDKGEIKEIGTHEELLAKQGFYYQLHKMQFEKKVKMI
jgi:ATP-binding cassette subfamily B protein